MHLVPERREGSSQLNVRPSCHSSIGDECPSLAIRPQGTSLYHMKYLTSPPMSAMHFPLPYEVPDESPHVRRALSLATWSTCATNYRELAELHLARLDGLANQVNCTHATVHPIMEILGTGASQHNQLLWACSASPRELAKLQCTRYWGYWVLGFTTWLKGTQHICSTKDLNLQPSTYEPLTLTTTLLK